MELDVKERIVISNLLPIETNFMTLKIMRKFKEALSFDEEENKILQFKYSGNQVTWKESENIIKDIQVGDLMTELIIKLLKQLDKDEKLTEEHFSLFEKFVENEK